MEKIVLMQKDSSRLSVAGEFVVIETPKYLFISGDDFKAVMKVDLSKLKATLVDLSHSKHPDIDISTGDIELDDEMKPEDSHSDGSYESKPTSQPTKEDVIAKLREMYPNISLDALTSCLKTNKI